MKRNGNGWEQILKHLYEERPLTTFEASKICGVVHSTVSNWIEEGKLIAYKTPGGHRRIKKKDLLLFLKLYEIPVPDELLHSKSFSLSPAPDQAISETALALPKMEKTNRILIVEDDQTVSNVLLKMLKESYPHFEILQAFDGFEAGKQIVAFSPDLIILDLILPGVDGFRVLRNIRQDEKLFSTKIIAISGFDSAENQERILQSGGADGFISKPVDLKQLRVQIENLLSESSAKK